jgi:hypothetical protein
MFREGTEMDPNTTLRLLRNALTIAQTGSGLERQNALEEIAEYAAALDLWLSRGGFLPDGWTR